MEAQKEREDARAEAAREREADRLEARRLQEESRKSQEESTSEFRALLLQLVGSRAPVPDDAEEAPAGSKPVRKVKKQN